MMTGQEPFDPRPVTRGLNLQEWRVGFLGIDSLYLVVEYPFVDIFEYWSSFVLPSDPRLADGVVAGDVVLRRGAHGYRLSVWDGDARLYLSDRVEERCPGQGMGVMLQLGPRWLVQRPIWADRSLRAAVREQLLAFGLSDLSYPVRLNRVDLTVDVLGAEVAGFSVDDWLGGWVGYASQKRFYVSSRGRLETISVGSSEGVVRFKVYDKVSEAVSRGTLGFWLSVWGLTGDQLPSVARFEWSVRPYEGAFEGLRYLDDLTFERFCGLLEYVVARWGALRVSADDVNRSRWPLHGVWSRLVALVHEWMLEPGHRVKRDYVLTFDLSERYLSLLVGVLAGAAVRVGLAGGAGGPETLAGVLSAVDECIGLHQVDERARKRWVVASRLAGG